MIFSLSALQSEEKGVRLLLAALLAIFALYVSLALTPSHYALGLRYLGAAADPLLLSARPIRSDEWIVMTPLFQTAVRGGFSTINQISPYHEPLKGFWALPILDWSLLFKPQVWGFWILPSAYAYSLYFAMLWSAFLAGYTILLRQLGVDIWIAALGATCLFSSHLVQVWWTSNAPTFAFAPWPLIIFLRPIGFWWKLPLLFWACAVWVFGFVYPPFMIPAAFALGVLLLAFRRDSLTVPNVVAGVLALAALGACFVLYFGELIQTMQATVYPGQRISTGGGVEETRLLAHLLPFFTTTQFTPLLGNTNECEVSVVATMLPLTLVFFVNYRSLAKALEENFVALWLVAVGLTAMLFWMLLPIPSALGKFLLWTYVPPSRMVWGFGLLLNMTLIILASHCRFRVTWVRLVLFSGSLTAAWMLSKIGFTQIWSQTGGTAWRTLMRSWFDWIPIAPFAIAAAIILRHSQGTTRGRTLFGAAAISGLITFGTFNPFQQALPIFNIPETPFLTTLRAQAKTNPNGWAVVPNLYGALFSGAGVTAINHTLTTPQLSFFRRIFPSMPEQEFNQAFNRYAHILPADTAHVSVPQNDLIIVPIAPFRMPISYGRSP